MRRPLFALLAAQHAAAAEGVTGVPEIIDRVVADVVSRENFNLFTQLRALAVQTIRAGGPVDPAGIAPADIAAKIRNSPLVATTGRKCGFALATFEQWFAAQAILDDVVGMDEVLASMETFNRWRYVLAIIAATADPARADKVMAALARWNPGAASWVVNETRASGLTRAFPMWARRIGNRSGCECAPPRRPGWKAWAHSRTAFGPPERSASISTTSRWPWASADITCVCGGFCVTRRPIGHCRQSLRRAC